VSPANIALKRRCGQVGKQENRRVAVSLSIATWTSSLPVAWRLYLPEIWASDPKKRKQAGVPEEIRFETKPQIALGQIRQAVEEGVAPGVVVADAGYGVDGRFRKGITELNLEYVVGVQSAVLAYGNRGKNHCRPNHSKARGGLPDYSAGTRTISQCR
jgi:SRSO17 transposase